MNAKSIGIFGILLLSVVMAMPAVQAASCGTVPSAESSLTSYCIPVTIASSSATSNAQVMLTFNALNYSSDLAANLQNIYVYNSISGKTVPAWQSGRRISKSRSLNQSLLLPLPLLAALHLYLVEAQGYVLCAPVLERCKEDVKRIEHA